jgi:hypothetical protein
LLNFYIQGGAYIAKNFLPKNFGDIGTFGNIALPSVLGAYIAGSFLPNFAGFFGDFGKFGDIAPPLYILFPT